MKCPSCARDFVRRVSRTSFWELPLSWLYVYPFKCQLCSHRFRQFQWGVRYIRVEKDRREYDRMEISLPLSFYGQDVSGEGILLSISMGGCSFTTGAKLESGAILNLSLQISKDIAPVVVEAVVVRNVSASSVGVEFLRWQPAERERLQLFIRGLLIGRGTNPAPRANHSELLVSR